MGSEETAMKTVLVVDDEQAMLRVFARMLDGIGCRTLLCCTPQQALEALAGTKADVIVCDQSLPGMTGLQFLRHARAMHPHTERLLMSGYVDKRMAADAIAGGDIAGIIHKPFDTAQVMDRIAQAIRSGTRSNG